MKNTVRIISLAIVLALCLATVNFASAQTNSSSLEGSWRLTSVDSDNENAADLILGMAIINLFGEISFSFSNGTVLTYISMLGKSEIKYGTYWTSGGWIAMTLDETVWLKYDVVGSMLIMSDSNGNSLIFNRK